MLLSYPNYNQYYLSSLLSHRVHLHMFPSRTPQLVPPLLPTPQYTPARLV